MAEIRQTERTREVLKETMACCQEYRHEFVMPEHLLLVLTDDECFGNTLNDYYPSLSLAEQIEEELAKMETVPEEKAYEPEASVQMGHVIEFARW